MKPAVAFIGFGEVAKAFADGWSGNGPDRITAYDIKTDIAGATREQKLAEYKSSGVIGCDTVGKAIAGADIVFSLVTADQATAAAASAASHLDNGCLYFDCNSCAPDTKRRNAGIIEQGGGRYLDVAIMLPVHPGLHETPMLVSGDASGSALAAMQALGMKAELAEGGIGAASSIKLVRSIMIKGMEALLAGCVLAGHKAGVIDTVLASLEKTWPGFDWQNRAAYAFERMMVHGERRAAEMRETALMVDQLGLDGAMSRATAEWQQTIGELRLRPGADSCQQRAQTILDALAAKSDNRSK